jgi:mersacidin/lichenicidin family type 2 lantibiotic
LRTASAVFLERCPDGKDLLEGVRDAALTFRGYLRTIEGPALSGADSETGPVFRSAIEVLRNESVAHVFGLPAAPGGNWPLDGTLKADNDSVDGAYLIEEIQRALNISSIRPPITEHRFMLMQKVAHYGAKTIVGVSEGANKWDSANRLQALAVNAYAWEKALQGLLFDIDVIRAWKDPQYRENLSPCEKAMVPPHPSGEVELKDIQLDGSSARAVVGFSTWTLYGICCCTGDLCPTGSTNTDYKCCRTSDIECGIIV